MPDETPSLPAPSPSGSPLDDPNSDRFRALLREPRLFLRQPDPYTAAIWAALLKPTSEVLASTKHRLRLMQDQPPPSDEPGEEQSLDDPMAIITLGEAIVASALLGDTKAQAAIADRIEGKVGLRKGDDDPESATRQKETLGIMRDIVFAFSEATRRGDDAKVITVDAGDSAAPK